MLGDRRQAKQHDARIVRVKHCLYRLNVLNNVSSGNHISNNLPLRYLCHWNQFQTNLRFFDDILFIREQSIVMWLPIHYGSLNLMLFNKTDLFLIILYWMDLKRLKQKYIHWNLNYKWDPKCLVNYNSEQSIGMRCPNWMSCTYRCGNVKNYSMYTMWLFCELALMQWCITGKTTLK